MKSKEEIINDSIKLENPPADYSLLEIHCFLALKQLLLMYHNKQISSENATRTKQHILADYDKRKKDYEFQTSMFREHVEHIKNTENARIKLHKILNGQDEYNKPITDESWAEALNICMEIIGTVFKGEF